jgi:hypothetical protein
MTDTDGALQVWRGGKTIGTVTKIDDQGAATPVAFRGATDDSVINVASVRE